MKGIPLKTWEIQAILEGRKSRFTRAVKTKAVNLYKSYGGLCGDFENNPIGDRIQLIKPRYQVRDILYVKEKVGCLGFFHACGEEEMRFHYCYPSDFYDTGFYEYYGDLYTEDCDDIEWIRNIHMPQEAARIFLRITGVRAERLRDTTIEEAIKDGVKVSDITTTSGIIEYRVWNRFEEQWNLDNKGLELEKNPWIWIYEFERVSKEEL